jgi:hypothetical protein
VIISPINQLIGGSGSSGAESTYFTRDENDRLTVSETLKYEFIPNPVILLI